MTIERARNKLERMHVRLKKQSDKAREEVDDLSMEDFMSEKGEVLCERSRRLSAATGYISVAIECLFQAEQIED